jgi:hypothetical protein
MLEFRASTLPFQACLETVGNLNDSACPVHFANQESRANESPARRLYRQRRTYTSQGSATCILGECWNVKAANRV